MNIRSMEVQDLQFAAGCTATAGWRTETLGEFEAFHAHDPRGCLIAEEAGRRIGICVAISYGLCGFIGELIVAPEERGKGIGRRLMEQAIEYLANRNEHGTHGAHSIYLDAVPAAIALYERLGFRRICPSLRFHAAAADIVLTSSPARTIRAMRCEDLPAVRALDREVFGADRGFFLEWRLHRTPELCMVMVDEASAGRLDGFILGRSSSGAVSAGPWIVRSKDVPALDLFAAWVAAAQAWTAIARDGCASRPALAPQVPVQATIDHAERVSAKVTTDHAQRAPVKVTPAHAQHASVQAADEPVGGPEILLGVLSSNETATRALRAAGFSERPDPSWRMVRGGDIRLGDSDLAYAIGSGAKG